MVRKRVPADGPEIENARLPNLLDLGIISLLFILVDRLER